jgi:hypothetical protein
MRCEEALNQLNAQADGELRAEEAAGLAAHLAECTACRAAANVVQAIDADLRSAFAPRREAAGRLAERVVAELYASAGTAPVVAPSVATTPTLAWGQALMAMAAGFLMAVILFRPWQVDLQDSAAVPAPEPIARLAATTGPVEMRPWKQIEFFRCPTHTPIAKDSIVRTGPSARCEIALEDGNAVRLDSDTEVTLRGADVVEVNRGRLWSASEAGREGVAVQTSGGTVVPKAAAEFALTCEPQGARLTVVDGEVDVETPGGSVVVGPGKKVRIVDGKVEDDPAWRDALLETAWVNSVLALHSSEHPELVERVSQLLANVGAAKLSFLYEDELRRLGDDGVPPLLAYLDSTRGTPDIAQRPAAARIVADVAEARWIGDLIELLTDGSAEVRYHAARGLERLTGRDQGWDAGAWRTQSPDSCEGAQRKWIDWWAGNRERYL